MNADLYVRGYAEPVEQKKKKENENQWNPQRWPDYALIFDCESRTTPDQSLTFGFWRFCKLENEIYLPLEEGIIHHTELDLDELNFLRKYARRTRPETTKYGSNRLRLYSRPKFVVDVLGRSIHAGAIIVCLNSGFDLSRLAVDWEKGEKGGWSLIFSQWFNPKTVQLQANKFYPRIVIKALNSKTSIIHSTRAPIAEPKKKNERFKPWPTARFLDVRTLLWALRNKSYSLKSACKNFGLPGKFDHTPTGRVDLEEVEYCRQDVRATVNLLNAAKQEFDLHPISPGADRMFSPASISKAYLSEMKILYPKDKIQL